MSSAFYPDTANRRECIFAIPLGGVPTPYQVSASRACTQFMMPVR
jgi:hypothetical protein